MRILTLSFFTALLLLFLSGCSQPLPMPTQTPVPTFTPIASTPTASATPAVIVDPSPTATIVIEPTPAPTSTPIPPEPTATPEPTPAEAEAPRIGSIPILDILPTVTPIAEGVGISLRDLPIGDPGEYINLTLGYWAHYPPEWYTRFGARPLLVSFSNLDPGQHNRQSMRAEGCLIELNAASNIYGFTLDSLPAQLPLSFANAEETSLAGRKAVRMIRSSTENPFDSEWIYVEAGDRLLILTFEYAREAKDLCRPAWENLLANWQWFEPDVVDYRNTALGYAVSHPRRWHRFNERESGITLSSVDPSQSEFVSELLNEGVVIHTTVLDNPFNLPLRQWVIENEGGVEQSNDIPLGDLLGVRIIRNDPGGQLQEMSGYFQGPLGKIYIINAIYPVARQWEFRPIANAVIYSFSF